MQHPNTPRATERQESDRERAQRLLDVFNQGQEVPQEDLIWINQYVDTLRRAEGVLEQPRAQGLPQARPAPQTPQPPSAYSHAARSQVAQPPMQQYRQAVQAPPTQQPRQAAQPPRVQEAARSAQQKKRKQRAEVSPEVAATIAILSLSVVLFIGLRIVLLDATMSTIGFASMRWIPQDWNASVTPILWGLLGDWSNWLLTQAVVVIIQSTLMPFVWVGFSTDNRIRFPVRIENPLGRFNVSPWLILFIWGGAIALNIGTTFKGVYSQIPLWEPIEVFSSIKWPKEGGELTFIALLISGIVSLGGENIVRGAFSGILSAVTVLRNS